MPKNSTIENSFYYDSEGSYPLDNSYYLDSQNPNSSQVQFFRIVKGLERLSSEEYISNNCQNFFIGSPITNTDNEYSLSEIRFDPQLTENQKNCILYALNNKISLIMGNY